MFEEIRWVVLHEIALYFAPMTGMVKGIRRGHLTRGRQIKGAGSNPCLAPLLSGLKGIRQEYRALERLAERRQRQVCP